MASIVTYQPTLGMLDADRTRSGYYTKMVDWITEVWDSVFAPWFTVEYTDSSYYATFTPINEAAANNYLRMTVDSSSNLEFTYKRDSSNYTTYEFGMASDPKIKIYSADYFFIGCGGTSATARPFLYGLLRETTFEGTEMLNAVTFYDNNLCFYNNGAYETQFANDSTYNTGQSDYYVLRPLVVRYSNLIMKDMYKIDGGPTGTLPKGQYMIGEDTYITPNPANASSDIALKL